MRGWTEWHVYQLKHCVVWLCSSSPNRSTVCHAMNIIHVFTGCSFNPRQYMNNWCRRFKQITEYLNWRRNYVKLFQRGSVKNYFQGNSLFIQELWKPTLLFPGGNIGNIYRRMIISIYLWNVCLYIYEFLFWYVSSILPLW